MRLATCHPTRKHQARGLCKSCYDKWLKANNTDYKERQLSNATVWAKANPEKMMVIKERRKAKDAADPTHSARMRDRALQRKYGITQKDYDLMFSKQKGRCAICHRHPGDTHYMSITVIQPVLFAAFCVINAIGILELSKLIVTLLRG